MSQPDSYLTLCVEERSDDNYDNVTNRLFVSNVNPFFPRNKTVINNPNAIHGIDIDKTYEKLGKTFKIIDCEYLANLQLKNANNKQKNKGWIW